MTDRLAAAASTACRRWLALANLGVAALLGLAFAAPALLALGFHEPAGWLYRLFATTCHQWPFRAYFLFGPQATYTPDELVGLGVASVYSFVGSPELGYKVAFCARNVAIYSGALLAGLAYARLRRPGPPLALRTYLLLIAPMAVDGVTQLAGLRESTWELRTATGLLFGAASVWLVYPRLDLVVRRASFAPCAPAGPASSVQPA